MAGNFNVNMKIDAKTKAFYQKEMPERLELARKRAVEAAGMVWADETKDLVQQEDKIDTSLYINSIGYTTDYPAHNHTGKGKRNATEEDVLYELEEGPERTELLIGSNVSYAPHLEKNYALMARGLDRARDRMKTVSEFQVEKTLGGG